MKRIISLLITLVVFSVAIAVVIGFNLQPLYSLLTGWGFGLLRAVISYNLEEL